jgi:hypothetical protein
MTGPSYPPAGIVAKRIEQLMQTRAAGVQEDKAAPMADASTIEQVITAAFWASLRREEGRSPRISLALMPPGESDRPLLFEQSLPLEPNVLGGLAPAVEKPRTHLGIWAEGNELSIWGLTRVVPTWCFVLEVVAPALLVVKYRRPNPSSKFVNVAVLEGADVKLIQQQSGMLLESPPVLGSLLNFYSSAGRDEADNLLIRIAASMRAFGRGGSLLVVPRDGARWVNSLVQPVKYSVIPPFPDLASFLEGQADDVSSSLLQFAVDALTGLTAVDGATVISNKFEPLAFGVKITVPDGSRRVDSVLVTEPIEGVPDTQAHPADLGGTRHLSAAQFAYEQRDSVSMVASQDGRFTVFAWSPSRQMVHAYRLETLLL